MRRWWRGNLGARGSAAELRLGTDLAGGGGGGGFFEERARAGGGLGGGDEFEAAELIGLSELGLVGDRPAIAHRLEAVLGLELWDGTLAEPTRLAFVGQRARTLILAPPGRGWVPTGRAAEAHPVDAVLAGRRDAQLELAEGDVRYRLRSVSE